MLSQEWFEMRNIRRRPVSERVWVPLRAINTIRQHGNYGYSGYKKYFFGLGSVAVPLSRRAEAARLGWMDIGILNSNSPYAFSHSYKPVDVYQYRDEEDLGVFLALEQRFAGNIPSDWCLHQDIVFAFGLLREGDVWLCPEEAFTEVARIMRDDKGVIQSLEIRAEFLRDYLSARRMALRLTWYQQRTVTVSDSSFINWENNLVEESSENERFEGRGWPIVEGGQREGETWSVFEVRRTDVDPEADVPVFGPESDENTEHASHYLVRQGRANLFMIQGEVWKNEWVEPADNSPRVRKDEVPPSVYFITDAQGTRESRNTLYNEGIGKWLWFRQGVVSEILKKRGASLSWYTFETGSIELVSGYTVHFGVNILGLITVYAYDIAKLPDWQQQIWSGFNVSPEGRVSAELLSAQMATRPANTIAPEEEFVENLEDLDQVFEQKWGSRLLRDHPSRSEIVRTVHRFRAADAAGLLELAKDIARLTADSFDTRFLHRIAPPNGEGKGSLKSLERVLGTLVRADHARSALTPLVGAYELRLGDAHLPSQQLTEAFGLAGIDPSDIPVQQATQLMRAVAGGIRAAADIVRNSI